MPVSSDAVASSLITAVQEDLGVWVGGEDALSVDVDQHLVIEPVDRVVQRGVMQSQLDGLGHLPVVARHGGRTPGDTAADRVLPVACGKLRPGRVAQQ
jgi:hypothetical protein